MWNYQPFSPFHDVIERPVFNFNDDEPLDHESPCPEGSSSSNKATVQMKTFTEVPAVSQSDAPDDFTVLINLKAPASGEESSSRVPVDLVTVLDVSGSMGGTKLELLKRAMGFVMKNLGPNDRLSVIAFASRARRLFPLRRMSESEKQQAWEAVNRLQAEDSTNIAEGLRLGAKVMEDRRYKNPVAGIILLSDGVDTCGLSSRYSQPDYKFLLPQSIKKERIPVHTFGFGRDHDASLMHSVSEMYRGTFSFIETESVIQHAFALCIGGLLSVVVKELQVNIECVDSGVSLCSLKSGSYPNQITPDGRMGNIDAGDLYAEEVRDFLVTVKVPTQTSGSETALVKARCVYSDPLTKELVTVRSEEVKIKRPEVVGQQDPCVEVVRQQNRQLVAEAMVLARDAAEKGNLSGATSILENCRKKLSESASSKPGDTTWLALEAELREMKARLASRHAYETSGRAGMYSASSSHLQQRAAAGVVFGAACSQAAAPRRSPFAAPQAGCGAMGAGAFPVQGFSFSAGPSLSSAAGPPSSLFHASDSSFGSAAGPPPTLFGASDSSFGSAAGPPPVFGAYQTKAMAKMVEKSLATEDIQQGNPSTHGNVPPTSRQP